MAAAGNTTLPAGEACPLSDAELAAAHLEETRSWKSWQFVLGDDALPRPAGTRALADDDDEPAPKRLAVRSLVEDTSGRVATEWQPALDKVHGPQCAECIKGPKPCSLHAPGDDEPLLWWQQLHSGLVTDRALRELTAAAKATEAAKRKAPDAEWRKEWSDARA